MVWALTEAVCLYLVVYTGVYRLSREYAVFRWLERLRGERRGAIESILLGRLSHVT